MNFNTWVVENKDYIEMVQSKLKEKLSSNPSELEEAITEIESHYGRLTELVAEAMTYIAQAEYKEICQLKADEKIDVRRARVKFNTCAEREIMEKIKGMVDTISQRIMYGMALMKSNAREMSNMALRERAH